MGTPGTWDLCKVKWPFGDHIDYCERDSEWLVELICKTCGRRPAVGGGLGPSEPSQDDVGSDAGLRVFNRGRSSIRSAGGRPWRVVLGR